MARELERLRVEVARRDRTIARLTALSRALRRGGQALRAENRELRVAARQSELVLSDAELI